MRHVRLYARARVAALRAAARVDAYLIIPGEESSLISAVH